MIQGDDSGQTSVLVHNCSPVDVVIERGDLMGVIDNVNECEYVEVNPDYINAISQQLKPPAPLSKEKEQLIREKFQSEVSDDLKPKYLQVLLDNHEAISSSKFDLGRSELLLQD